MRASQSLGCCNNIHTGLQYWPCRGHSLQLSIATICDLSIVVAEGHSELWRQKATKRVSVTLQMLWLLGHNELWRPKPAKVVTNLAKNPPNGNTGWGPATNLPTGRKGIINPCSIPATHRPSRHGCCHDHRSCGGHCFCGEHVLYICITRICIDIQAFRFQIKVIML